jgi:hypothetical protein
LAVAVILNHHHFNLIGVKGVHSTVLIQEFKMHPLLFGQQVGVVAHITVVVVVMVVRVVVAVNLKVAAL